MKKLIGVFDSGVGGAAIAQAIAKALPDDGLISVSDTPHMPYGDKPPAEVLGFVEPMLQDLVAQGCDVIIVACNTVTTTLITELRHRIHVPLIGIEPMVRPAAEQTQTGTIAICATPSTLKSSRYHWLKKTYAKHVQVLEPNCSQWAYMIEHNQVNEQLIEQQINEILEKGADVIVLGCTHYHWIEEFINRIAAGRAHILQPEQPVVAQLKRVLAQLP